MITKFEIFESLNSGEPELGDYVICSAGIIRDLLMTATELDFVSNNIGKITRVLKESEKGPFRVLKESEKGREVEYIVGYRDIVEEIVRWHNWKGDFVNDYKVKCEEITHWSKNISDLERVLAQKRFDL